MPTTDQQQFLASWQHEAQSTLKLLRALPENQYDFRPDADGRSLGELAWHLAEIDGYIAAGVAARNIDFSVKQPGLERPRKVSELADGYARVHAEAEARIRAMKPEDFDCTMPFMDREMRAGDILWYVLLMHMVHHRGQLVLMCRLAGGVPPGIYGPSREEMAGMRASG